MALDTSSNAYEQVYKPSGPEENGKYYEGYVDRKETFIKWVQYWCVLKEHNIHFFKDVNTQIKDNYVGFLALEQPTNVEIVKSKEGRYEWTIKTKKGKTTLRTNVSSLRDDWISSMERSLKNEPPSKGSYILEGSGPVSPKHKVSTSPTFAMRSRSRKSSSQSSHTISEEQVASMQQLSSDIGANMSDTNEELRIQDELLSGNNSWYQAYSRREEVEKMLSSEEKGVFIVRDHVDNRTGHKMGYVISLKDETGQMRHHRIKRTNDALFIVGYEGKCFESLHNLLRFFISSQRKKIILVPFNLEKHQISFTGYEDMVRPQSVNNQQSTPPYSKVTRSHSVQHRQLPTGCHPTGKVGRSDTMKDRILPTPPSETQNGHERREGGYVEMTSPSKSQTNVSQRPLPAVPTADQSYINVPPPMTVDESCSYENTANDANSPYINAGAAQIQEEQAPTLPPRKRRVSVGATPNYVNYPRSEMPGRNPFRKSNTLT